MNITFIGLGVMGAPMAAHLAQAGHAVTVYNRTTTKTQTWLAQYQVNPALTVSSADTLEAAVKNAEIVMLCVGNDDDLRQLLTGESGIIAHAPAGCIIVDHTTTSALVAREMAAACLAADKCFIDAPVSGGQSGAEKGQLTIMCGGDEATVTRITPVLSCYAKAVTWMGESGNGQLTKMVNQICIGGVLQGLAEAMHFGTQAGLDMHKVIDVIRLGAAQSWQMDNRAHTMIDDQYNFGFAVDWMRKDLGLVLDESRRNHAQLPITALIDDFYREVQKLGGGRWDTSSLLKRLN
jgi:3-hydroxyisobutyrate dehydrogenase-like beta-hydroxyacid dehydrogenase